MLFLGIGYEYVLLLSGRFVLVLLDSSNTVTVLDFSDAFVAVMAAHILIRGLANCFSGIQKLKRTSTGGF